LVGHQLSNVRHPLWIRSLITLWGIWFATALTEPAGVLACPLHGGAGHHTTSGPVADASSEHGSHSQHLARASTAHTDASATESPAPEPGHACSCLGDCCSATPAQVADVLDPPPLAVLGLRGQLAFARGILGASTQRDHALPFAIGPPIAATA
jgi:hypothetical protein